MKYDPDTGVFTRRVARSNTKAGDQVGTLCADGYMRVLVDYRRYLVHRLAWLYVYGEFPVSQLDHKNGTRSDNRIANLRQATSGENSQNIKVRTSNPSGKLGVSRHAGKWRAAIAVNGKRRHLGRFSTPEEAAQAYAEAKASLHLFQPVQRSCVDSS